MENVVQEEVIVDAPEEKSTVLSDAEVQATLNGEDAQADVTLPSEDNFVMPDKFQGKSAEEIARAYAELEKMKTQPKADEPEAEDVPKGDDPDAEYINPMLEEGRPEGSKDVPVDQFAALVDEYDANGQLSEESYKALEELGYNKAFVDEKIDYINYKREREADAILEPYGGSEEFKKVSAWAAESFTEAQLNNINAQLASGNKATQDAVLSSLFMGYKQSAGKVAAPQDVTLHTNQPQSTRTEGYATKSEYLKDAKDPRYEKDAGYRKQVEQKMLKTDMSKWY
ncbi:scaffolding protein [Roseobacter phage CRP-143]|nr:scaffolding protein [Roseobacter phage CRP-143]